jgi:outer membrane protein OmpA-like peptidoglycan-associated protein
VKGDVSDDGGVKEAEWMPQVGDLLSALDTPGAELTLTGDSARVGGWLTEEERSSVAARVRGAHGANIAVSETEDRRAEALRIANARASAALAGLDSIEAADVRPERLVSALNLSVIDFADGRAEIPTSAREILGRAARALLHTPTGTRIVVAGHTDAAGDSAANLALSEERARAVVRALVEEGVEPGMLTVVGYGGTRPVDPAATGSARFHNQRIEYAVAEWTAPRATGPLRPIRRADGAQQPLGHRIGRRDRPASAVRRSIGPDDLLAPQQEVLIEAELAIFAA